jgi:hypothetical protein
MSTTFRFPNDRELVLAEVTVRQVPLRCDGVDAPAPASGSIESCAKMVNPLKERRP